MEGGLGCVRLTCQASVVPGPAPCRSPTFKLHFSANHDYQPSSLNSVTLPSVPWPIHLSIQGSLAQKPTEKSITLRSIQSVLQSPRRVSRSILIVVRNKLIRSGVLIFMLIDPPHVPRSRP